MDHQPLFNFQFETQRGFVVRTNLNSNQKAFLTALIDMSFKEGQRHDGQTYCGAIKDIGLNRHLRRSLNTTRDIMKGLQALGLLTLTDSPGKAYCFCINWDRVLDLPTVEDPIETPPQSDAGPLQYIPATPPILEATPPETGGHPSNFGRGTPPILEPTPPKAGGVTGGVPHKFQVKNDRTPPKLEGSRRDMSLSVLNTYRQRHVQPTDGWWPKEIVKQNLQSRQYVQELWKLAVANGWFTPTDGNRLNFFAHASRCCAAKNPGGAFTANVRAKRLFWRPEDMVWARKAVDGLEHNSAPFTASTLLQERSSIEATKAALEAFAASRRRE